MEEGTTEDEKTYTKPMDIEYVPYQLIYKIHRNKQSSQIEIIQVPYFYEEPQPEEEPPIEPEPEPEPVLVAKVFAPPLKPLKEKGNWWEWTNPIVRFNNPRIRSRLEKLMGSNVVRITDRKYMIKLQERIKEDHLENQKKRIQEREADEVEREKKLILEGKIPIEEAPKELKNHPVCKINQITKKILEDKKTKMKSSSKTSNYKTSAKRMKEAEKVEKESAAVEKEEEEEEMGQTPSILCVAESSDPVDEIAKGFMFCKEEYDKLKYEAPLVKMLKEVENVEEMYKLADEIVGPLKNEKIGK